MIPKNIIQTSRKDEPNYMAVHMINSRSRGWRYKHYSDKEVIKFFMDNPLPEFPNIIEKFYSFSYGEHRADLFRYYYLYLKGGVYFDTDLMIEVNIDEIIKDYKFVSVNSTYFPKSIFQGFIACVPNHPILYDALKNMYQTPNHHLIQNSSNFHDICRNFYNIVSNYHDKETVYLYEEVFGDKYTANIIDKKTKSIMMKHYHIKKIIPGCEL